MPGIHLDYYLLFALFMSYRSISNLPHISEYHDKESNQRHIMVVFLRSVFTVPGFRMPEFILPLEYCRGMQVNHGGAPKCIFSDSFL